MTPKIVFIDGKFVTLRPIQKDDLPTVLRWINDPEITQHLMAYRPMVIEDEEKWYEGLIGSTSNFVFAIETKGEDPKFIGTMGLHGINHRTQVAGTGALIGDKDCHGKGYGTDAKMHLLHWAFSELNLRKVVSSVLATNPRSKRYLEKTGYREVGKYTAHHFVRGEFVDEFIMEVFRDDFMEVWKTYSA
jgi:RimJ/RimL family protein N-acetyltransferase